MTSGKFVTTLGYERRFNPAFLYDDREEFVAFMTHGQPSRPANVNNIVAINQGQKPLANVLPVLNPLPADEVVKLFESRKVYLIDIREYEDYGYGHAEGAYNFQLSSSEFEQRIGWVLDDERPFVLIAESEQDVSIALNKLAYIGLESRYAGFLNGGIAAWSGAGANIRTLPQISVTDLAAGLAADPDKYQVLDVRETEEFEDGHIAGAIQLSYKQFAEKLGHFALETDRPIVVACAGGFRSSTASSVLLNKGLTNLINLTGGMEAWKAAELPHE